MTHKAETILTTMSDRHLKNRIKFIEQRARTGAYEIVDRRRPDEGRIFFGQEALNFYNYNLYTIEQKRRETIKKETKT